MLTYPRHTSFGAKLVNFWTGPRAAFAAAAPTPDPMPGTPPANTDFGSYASDDGRFLLSWEVDLQQSIISFSMRAQTSGWVSFGISDTPYMPEADTYVGWIDADGTPTLLDCYSKDYNMPVQDPSQVKWRAHYI